MITTLDTQKAVEFFDAKVEFTTGPAELNSMLQRHEDITIIDVRHEEDYQQSHIRGAINLPQERWESFEGLSKEKINIVYCYMQQCHLSAKACKLFAEHGYPVMELEGGFEEWQRHSFPVEK